MRKIGDGAEKSSREPSFVGGILLIKKRIAYRFPEIAAQDSRCGDKAIA
jgi:hypothetical protein